MIAGVPGVAGSCGPPAHGGPFLLPSSRLGRVAWGSFLRKTDDPKTVLPELPGASLRDGGPAVVAQLTGLANQVLSLIVCELRGHVLGAVKG